MEEDLFTHSLPSHAPGSSDRWQVDLRGRDLRALNLAGREKDLSYADFDSRTRWPKGMDSLSGFSPARFMALGKDPGLGVHALHKRGITGKGISVAIIDAELLVDHSEYKDRLRMYEEIHVPANRAQMHGAAVASIAVGKTVGVAPEADLYYIAEQHGTFGPVGGFHWDFTYLAQAIDRVLEVSLSLPRERRIRVISIQTGWGPRKKGYREVVEAVERAKKQGILVVSSSFSQTYEEEQMAFHALGKEPLSDPNSPASYEPGLFWAKSFFERGGFGNRGPGRPGSPGLLLVPMDSRCIASPTGVNDYVFYRSGGWSWSIPYVAGLYALACQVKPDVTPQEFWRVALSTGDTIQIKKDGKTYSFGKIVNPVKLINRLKGEGIVAMIPGSMVTPRRLGVSGFERSGNPDTWSPWT